MLDLDDQEAGCLGRDPPLVEVVRLLLLDQVVPFELEPAAVIGLKVGVGWFGAEAPEIGGVVSVKHHQGIARLGVLLESLRYQDVGSEVHRAAPELGEEITLDPDVFDILCVLRFRDWRYHFIHLEGVTNRPGGIDRDPPGRGIEIAGGRGSSLRLSTG